DGEAGEEDEQVGHAGFYAPARDPD
ncbi:MAG: hypothetical protein QOE27_2055, partial [Solirubrobacteraceae bacterium]|nr:hypothetical protein [Solirubrobacteraceae bacterium]